MTYIERLVMSGFKSFAMKTELVLGRKFNCVLGPNGSGKSNVMDALSFVLGKGSAKGMRAEKSSNLIYNGGKTKQPAKQGEVSIYFNNDNRTFPTEEKTVKITRIVKQTGQSIYKINDQTRTRQQILELLSMARINPDGYNIILQGDIVRFVEMSPDERRKIIEEISGISVYEEKKKKAESELEKVEAKLSEADIILSERKVHLDELKNERDQALKHQNLTETLNRSRATLLNHEIKKKEEQLEKIRNNTKEYSEKIKELTEEIKEITKTIEEKKAEERKINEEIESRGEKDQVELHKEVESLKVNIATSTSRIDSCNIELEKVAKRKLQLTENLTEIKAKMDKAEKERKEFGDLLKSKESMLKEIEKKIEKYRKENNLDNAGDMDKRIEDLDKEIEKSQQETHSLREEQQELTREKDRLEFQIQSIDEKILKVKEVEKEYKTEIEQLKKDRDELKRITLSLSKELDENQSVVAQLNNAREKLEGARSKIATLSAKQMTLKEINSGNVATQKILESKDKFGKVYGTVSDLGSVKSKFSLALEIAAGPRIKGIVVEDDKTASECIKYLQKNKLGTATFLPLNKIKAQGTDDEAKKLLKANGVLGLATDLISYDPKFSKVFSYVFGNTLIVEDIDVARKLGVGSIRMTTLTGDLVETSGAMHGGFRERKTGAGFKEDEVQKELKEFEEKEQQYSGLVTKLESKRKDSDDMITELREKKANLEGEIIKKERSLHLDSDDLKASMKVKEEFIEKLKEVEKRFFTLQTTISSKNTSLAKLKIDKQRLRDEVGELRNPKKLAELNAFEQKKSELKEDILKTGSEIRTVEAQISTILSPEQDNTKKIIVQHEKEEKEFKDEINLLKENIKSFKEELKIKEENEKKFIAKFKSLFADRNKINAEVQKLTEKLLSKDKIIRENELKSNAFSLDIARINAENAALQEEYKKYKDILVYTNKSIESLKEAIRKSENELENIGNVNMKALEIYEKVEKEYNSLNEKKDKLRLEKEDVLLMMNEIETKKKDLFLKAFETTNENFKKKFSLLSTKGEAYLEIENSDDPLQEGVVIKVRIIGKKFLDIRSLSGGEKTMTALAFIFSIQENDPASFYILDEVDAALDKRNAEKLADLIKQYSDKAQYLIISHNDGVISQADTLYGVSMNEHGMSKVVSLKV